MQHCTCVSNFQQNFHQIAPVFWAHDRWRIYGLWTCFMLESFNIDILRRVSAIYWCATQRLQGIKVMECTVKVDSVITGVRHYNGVLGIFQVQPSNMVLDCIGYFWTVSEWHVVTWAVSGRHVITWAVSGRHVITWAVSGQACYHLSCERAACDHLSCERVSWDHLSCARTACDHLSCERTACDHLSCERAASDHLSCLALI